MKTKRLVSILGLALAAIAFAGGDARVHAQPTKPAAPALKATALEEEARRLYDERKLVGARTKAEQALEANPDSILANYVLGLVFREAEGDLARAMYRLNRARKAFEDTYGSSPPQTSPWAMHKEIILAIASLAGEMEEYEYQIEMLDFHDALYEPKMVAAHAWPLLRMGKYDAARSAAKNAISVGDPYEQSLGRNALCAIEGEARGRQAYFDACLASLAAAKKSVEKDKDGPQPVVHQYNAALAAYAVVRLDEVERLAKEGSGARALTIANPWRILTRLYTDGARPSEAVQAALQMQSWRAHQAASLRDQDRAETDVALATLLLVAGEAESAERLIQRAIDRPDRRGLVSSKPDQALGAHALLRRAILRTRAEQLAEKSSWSGTSSRPKAAVAVLAQRTASWADDERIVSVLGHSERLDSTFRPYLSGGLEPVPSWLAPDLVEVLGAGIAGVALAKARREEHDFPAALPYFDAMEAEIAFQRGDHDDAIKLARKAIDKLPKGEGLLAARAAAIGGEAARRRGDRAAALSLLEQALQRDGGVIRRLGFAIPARISGSGDAAVARAVVLLGRSPRLRDEPWGFQITVAKNAGGLDACLKSANGGVIRCVSLTPRPKTDKEPAEEPDDFAARLVEHFHRDAFAMRVGMTAHDLDSLDGSTTAASQAQRESLQGVLNEAAKDAVQTP